MIKQNIIQYLPWAISIIGIYSSIEIGNKKSFGWIIKIFTQLLWSVWIITSENWGLIPLNTACWIVSIRNWVKWRFE